MNNGYVYVLINPSLNGMVKIGKTTRGVEERAKELSSATGVPTPYIVVYYSYFDDCDRAEKYVHERLENQNYRVSKNREFFEIDVKIAIDTVIEATNIITDSTKENTKIVEDTVVLSPSDEMYQIAENFYYGINGEIQDENEAFEYYKKALKLGCIKANLNLGYMVGMGIGTRFNFKKSKEYFNEALKNGFVEADLFRAIVTEENALDVNDFSYGEYYKRYLNNIKIDENYSIRNDEISLFVNLLNDDFNDDFIKFKKTILKKFIKNPIVQKNSFVINVALVGFFRNFIFENSDVEFVLSISNKSKEDFLKEIRNKYSYINENFQKTKFNFETKNLVSNYERILNYKKAQN